MKKLPRRSALAALPPPHSRLTQQAGGARRWMAGGEESGREPKGGHRGVLGLQTGEWAPGLAGMGLLSGSRERSLLIPVSLWHQPHLITVSPCIKISGVCCLEETNPRSLFKTSAPTLVLLSALLSPLLSQEAEESVRWGVGIAACEPEQGQVQLPGVKPTLPSGAGDT